MHGICLHASLHSRATNGDTSQFPHALSLIPTHLATHYPGLPYSLTAPPACLIKLSSHVPPLFVPASSYLPPPVLLVLSPPPHTQDRQLLAAISRNATTTTNATTVTSSPIAAPDPVTTTSSPIILALLEWPRRPTECPSATTAAPNTQRGAPPHSHSLEDDDGATTTAVDPGAAVAAGPHHLNNPNDLQEAFQFRLGLKVCLEQCLKAVIARAKELDALQTVR